MFRLFKITDSDKLDLQGKIFTYTAYVISTVCLILFIKQFIISNTFFSKMLDLGGFIFPLILLYFYQKKKKSQVILSQLLMFFLIAINTLSALNNGGLIPGTVLIYLGFIILTLFSMPLKNIIATTAIIWICLYYVIIAEFQNPQIRLQMINPNDLLSNNIIMSIVMAAIFLSLIIIKNGYDHENRINKEQAKILKEQHVKLELADNFRTRLMAIISHDVRSPLANLQGLMELVDQKIFSPDQAIKYFPEVNQKIKTTNHAINNILLWASLTLKQETIVKRNVKISPIIEEEIQKASSQFSDKQILFSNEVSADLLILVDPELFKAILRNLIHNALKFTAENGKITVHHTTSESHHIFSVMDTGVGMSKSILENLFTTNTNSASGTHGETGTGVGLILCKDFIEYHGGKIWAESQSKSGSTFYFSLPKA